MKTKFFFAQVKKINEQERTLDAIASTSDLDRDSDIILPSAFEKSLKPFKDNPVILACHQHRLTSGSSPVIGSAVPDSIKIEEKRVLFTMRFAQTPLGEEYWQLYRDKHMRAFSIGFIPIEWADEKDEQVGYIRTYSKIELLEISAVPVPSNRRALARVAGYFDDDDTKDQLIEAVKAVFAEQSAELTKELSEIRTFCEEGFEDIKSIIIAEQDGLAKGLLLGAPSDSSGPDGDKEKAGQLLSQIKELIHEQHQL